MARPMIRVLPLDELAAGIGGEPARVPAPDPLAWAPSRTFTPSGRSALGSILASLGLDPGANVLITNSSGQTYVSSCVTCTVFNHCRPSRVLDQETKAILVIHEYGFPHPQLSELLEVAHERGIPLIEDCAHSLDSALDDRPLGSYGDFAIFSLPKVLPVASGGILVSAAGDAGRLGAPSAEAEAAYADHLALLPEYSRRRRANYEAVRALLPNVPLLLESSSGVTPWHLPLVTRRAAEIRRRSRAVEWGSTLEDDLLLVTTNPLVEPDALVAAVSEAFEAAPAP
jgi:DegT/DnrJ/EryC1/StrS aminotransferase family